jgi:mono/diheme cytochrome c family protein
VLASANAGHVLAWKLGGGAALPAVPTWQAPVVAAIDATIDPERRARGERTFFRYCATCHGPAAIAGGTVPDLRQSSPAVYGDLANILGGSRLARGMPRFDFLGPDDVSDLHAYLLSRRAELAAQH